MRGTVSTLAGLALCTALVACSGGGPNPPPGPTDPPPARTAPAPTGLSPRPAGPLTVSDVRSALMTVDALGDPWDASSRYSPSADLDKALRGCADLASAGPTEVTARASFQGGQFGPFMTESISVSTLDHATELMAQLPKSLTNCARFGTDVPGLDINFTLDPMTMPKEGDDLFAAKLTSAFAGSGAYAYLITVRVGPALISVAIMSLIKAPDVAETQRIVRTAVTAAAPLTGR